MSRYFLKLAPALRIELRLLVLETNVIPFHYTDSGGKGRIRTYETFLFNGFQDRRLKPLGHFPLEMMDSNHRMAESKSAALPAWLISTIYATYHKHSASIHARYALVSIY
jgi:hypothetical protein